MVGMPWFYFAWSFVRIFCRCRDIRMLYCTRIDWFTPTVGEIASEWKQPFLYIRLAVSLVQVRSNGLSHTTRLVHPLGLTSSLNRDFHGGDRFLSLTMICQDLQYVLLVCMRFDYGKTELAFCTRVKQYITLILPSTNNIPQPFASLTKTFKCPIILYTVQSFHSMSAGVVWYNSRSNIRNRCASVR